MEQEEREGLFKEPQAFKVSLGPVSLVLDHSFESFRAEGFPWAVKRNRHPAAVRVKVVLVGSGLAVKGKAVSDKGRDKFSGGKAAKAPIVDSHGSDGYSYLRFSGYLYLLGWSLGHFRAMLNQAFHHHPDHLYNVA
jgi:hypothetical protein